MDFEFPVMKFLINAIFINYKLKFQCLLIFTVAEKIILINRTYMIDKIN